MSISLSDRLTVDQSEDLLPHQMKINRNELKEERTKAPPKVTNPGVLMTIGQQAMQKLVANAFAKLGIDEGSELPSHRTVVSDKIRWSIPNILNNVTEIQFHNMVTQQAWGTRTDIVRPQPNGDWQPIAYRFVELLDENDNTPYMHLVIRWMDLNGKTDIEYINGAPSKSTTVNVQNNNDEIRGLVDNIMAKDANNDQLIGLLTQLVANQGSSNTVVAGPTKQEPPEEIAVDDPAPVKRKRGRPRKKRLPPGV